MQDYAQASPLIVSCNNMLAPATQQLATPEYSAFQAKRPSLQVFLADDCHFCILYLIGHLSNVYGRGDICAEYHMA